MAEIIAERRTITEYRKVIEFEHVDGKDRGWYSFSADDHYNPVFDNPLQEESYRAVSENEKFTGPFDRIERRQYVENAKAICECGKEIELYSQYHGACECEHCGRWHNLFGQELLPPEMWGER